MEKYSFVIYSNLSLTAKENQVNHIVTYMQLDDRNFDVFYNSVS